MCVCFLGFFSMSCPIPPGGGWNGLGRHPRCRNTVVANPFIFFFRGVGRIYGNFCKRKAFPRFSGPEFPVKSSSSFPLFVFQEFWAPFWGGLRIVFFSGMTPTEGGHFLPKKKKVAFSIQLFFSFCRCRVPVAKELYSIIPCKKMFSARRGF